jgi:zinc protease
MKHIFIIGILLLIGLMGCKSTSSYKTTQATDANGYTYEYVKNDPLKTRIYTLENGLKVYITPNTDEPRFTGLIGVRAGSTSDPIETTGLAHYFEHMMFKGTERMGTTNWAEESKLIKQIEEQYEKHKVATDPDEKKRIYKSIDSLSQEAAKYVATNEYDKLMSAIGARSTNAGTSYESTVYINDVPVNELERWAQLESERFKGIVLRLFHTELETVYEEFNMYQDQDSERQFNMLMKNLFPTHPYGRDVIGFPDHLKNPSMINIQQFYNNFYVPNNMAITLSGDLNYEETIQMIDKYFGNLESKELPDRTQPVEEAITQITEKEVVGPEAENVMLAFRLGGVGSVDEGYMQLIDMILTNSKAGLVDLNLVQQQKVLSATTFFYALKDYGIFAMQGEPRQDQSLNEVKDLMLGELEKIKKGEFDEWLIEAIVNDLKLNQIRRDERNMGRAYNLMNEFINGQTRQSELEHLDKLAKITKADLVKFANEKFADNYVVVYKRQGENSNLVKVEKPAITAVPVNRDLESEFAKNFMAQKTSDIEPMFIDFNEKIEQSNLQNGCNYYYIQNESNELFTLRYIVDMGRLNNLKFDLAVGYLKFIGTSKYSAPDLQKELYRYGLDFNVSADAERSYITISGLGSSFEKGVELLEHIIAEAVVDPQAYTDYVSRLLKQRQDEKSDQAIILRRGMLNYGMYGQSNPQTYLLTDAELKAVDPTELVGLIKQMTTFEHSVFYYGPLQSAEAKQQIAAKHKLPEQLQPVPVAKQFTQVKPEKSKVYLVDFDINQVNIMLLANDIDFDKSIVPAARIYNEFYGSGLSSVVFQEIRESKALAYSAYSSYSLPSKTGRLNSVVGYVGTQADKLSIATSTLLQLLNDMPMATNQYNMAREAIVKVINSERITKEQIFWTWQRNKDRGIDYDIRRDEYKAAQTMDIDAFKQFFDQHIKGHNYTFLVLGKKSTLDMKALEKLGSVQELTLEEVFGY